MTGRLGTLTALYVTQHLGLAHQRRFPRASRAGAAPERTPDGVKAVA
nr:hypothetical protein [Micromonospora acroterricola]